MKVVFVLTAAVLTAALGACKPGTDASPRAGQADPAPAPLPATPPAIQPPDLQAPAAPAPIATEAPPVTPSAVRYFYFGNHVPRTEITAVEGVDTAHAVLKGVTTANDAYAYCVEGMGDPTAAAGQCAGERKAQPERMTADCIARTVSDGGAARWIRDEPTDDGKIRPVWRDVASGETRDYSGAGGGYVLTAAFRILCPAASTRISTQD